MLSIYDVICCYSLVVCGMDEVCIFSVYLQNVEYHLPSQCWQGEYLAEDGMAA